MVIGRWVPNPGTRDWSVIASCSRRSTTGTAPEHLRDRRATRRDASIGHAPVDAARLVGRDDR